MNANFNLILKTIGRLHSSGTRKFLQVMVKGIESQLELTNLSMTCDSNGVTLHDNNPESVKSYQCQKNLITSLLWEIEVEPLQAECQLKLIKVNFSLDYAQIHNGTVSKLKKRYHCKFDVTDYTTLFRIEAKLEPGELCRVGSVYNLNLKVLKMHSSPFVDLMYEVMPDQNLWAVVGRTAGVISMAERDAQSVMVEGNFFFKFLKYYKKFIFIFNFKFFHFRLDFCRCQIYDYPSIYQPKRMKSIRNYNHFHRVKFTMQQKVFKFMS